ncbi:MAG: hypothetical protein JO215_11445 [Ktedonobacteraceae bacterium]|nr:hypothetical protein [Ktedonobacteraceae bacterium]
MPIGQYQKLSLPLPGVLISVCLSVLFAFSLFPLTASAYSTTSSLSKPTFHVSAGFNSRYRDSNWVPVQVSLRNDSADFSGFVSIDVPAPSASMARSSPMLTYQEAVTLPTGSQKQVTLNVPVSVGDQGSTQAITVNLLDANNQKISSETTTLRSIGPSDIFAGILSDQTNGFGPLNTLPLADPSASILVEPLNASTMPTVTEVLKNFDLIILDDFTTSNLSKNQLMTLQNWVTWGGSLIVVGGPDWRRTLSPLPSSLLPVSMIGTKTLPRKTALLPIGGPTKGGPEHHPIPDTVQGAVTASTAIPAPHTTVALSSDDTTPLLVQEKLGQGMVCYLAFDPTLNPVLNWPGTSALWQGLLLRMLGDQVLTSGPNVGHAGSGQLSPGNSSGSFSSLLQSSLPNMLPPNWLILVLLLGYVAVLGPIRLLLVHFLKKRDWSWRIALSTIVIFSALSYTLALQQKGTSVVSSSISILQLAQPDTTGTPAHTTTYVGVYLPNQGNFQVNVPGRSLVQTYTESSSQGLPATMVAAENETNVKLQGINTWSLRTLVTKQDRHLPGSIIPHLTFQSNNLLRGTVTNSLPYALNNAYLLISNHFQSLGNMAPGETRSVSLSLENVASSANNLMLTSLADQIAASNNLQVPYSAYYNSSQRLNPLQRHMAQLAILSGENEQYCGTVPCFQSTQPFATASGVLVNSSSTLISGNGPSTQVNSRDPLLVPGSPATLIGWIAPTSHTGDTVDVVDSRIAGTQETFLQTPLNVSFSDPTNQSVNVPSDMITGQLIDAQSQSAQTQSPGVYTLNAGSMTFEFALPGDLQLRNGNITLTEPSSLTQGAIPLGQGTASIIDVNHIQIFLYNWQKQTWERFAFNQFSLSINNAQSYIDSNGRIVMQFANQNASQGTAVFSKPSLQLRGLLAT